MKWEPLTGVLSAERGLATRGVTGDDLARWTGVTGAGRDRRVGATEAVKDTDLLGRGNVCDSADMGEVGRESGMSGFAADTEHADAHASIPFPDGALKSTSIPRPVPNESMLASSRGVIFVGFELFRCPVSLLFSEPMLGRTRIF